MNIGIASEKMKLDSGQLSLDFANTVGWHASENPVEKIHTYQELIDWALGIALITNQEAQQLTRMASGKVREAQKIYERAIDLREAVYRIFSAHAMHQRPAANDLVIFNKALNEALSNISVAYDTEDFHWEWNDAQKTLDAILWPIIRSAAELLTSADLNRLGRCEDDRGCGWLFLDTSHNRSRRWCGTSCGNRAKVKRFRDRQKETE